MSFEDHFSQFAGIYSKYRPGYPPELFKFLAEQCKEHRLAWDCGTGNGQAALELTQHFISVYATDASKEQIEHAVDHPSIIYKVEPAEKVTLQNNSVDLVTVAVAVHWFNYDEFYPEVIRVLKPEGIIAVWTYQLPRISPEIDAAVNRYYSEILWDYWPERFHHVHTRYIDLPFPFIEIPPPEFSMITEWNLDQLAGFLSSWSAVNNFIQTNSSHPLNKVWDELKNSWGDEKTKRRLHWPLHVRVGKKK
jgi:SAM-dependent methyltransferase